MTDKDDRIGAIMRTLRVTQAVTIKEMASKLAVSEMTVRRDLDVLAAEGLVRRIPGGAILNVERAGGGESSYQLSEQADQHRDRKQRIGRAAALMVEPGDSIILDIGTTTEQVARFLPQDVPVTIICFALNVLMEVYRNKQGRFVFAGGEYHENTMMFESPEGVELVRRNRANKAFMSAAGVSSRLGVTVANRYEVAIKQAALECSDQRLLLVDSSKFGVVKEAHYAELTDFDRVITDDGIPQAQRQALSTLGVGLSIV
jgi:DeoR family deoxyribose operon repressor